MALQPGVMSVTIEYAQGLKDRDWVFRQSPYCIISVGAQTFRSEVARDGGTSPVWNQTFQFNIINENDVSIMIKDHDLGPDEYVGSASFTLTNARMMGMDRQNVPVISRNSGREHGFISVVCQWQPNGMPYYGGGAGIGAYPMQQQMPMMQQQQQQPMYGGGGGMPMMQQGMYGQPMYGQPAYGQPAYGQPTYGQPGMQGTEVIIEGHRHHHHHHHRDNVEVFIQQPMQMPMAMPMPATEVVVVEGQRHHHHHHHRGEVVVVDERFY